MMPKQLNFGSRSRLGLMLLSIVLVLGAGIPIQAQPPGWQAVWPRGG